MSELVELLKQLFVNRTDVYAKQQPSGEYFKIDAPITTELIEAHLNGEITFGSYCLNKENRVNKICFDFDGENLTEVFEQAKKACLQIKEFGYSPLLEFSGKKGYHVWIFFEETQASIVRGLAEKISSGFNCEIFPKQDVLEVGGYGNLTKSPLGIHRESKRRSFFLNDVFEPVPLENTAALLKEKFENRHSLVVVEQKTLGKKLPMIETKPLPPKVKSILIEGAKPGNRHKSVFILASEMYNSGHSQEETLQVALEFNANCTPPKGSKTIERHIKKLYGEPKKYLQKTWEQAKAIARADYVKTEEVSFPNCINFSDDITINSRLEDKTPLWLAVPYVSQKKDGGKGIFYLDDTKPENTILFYDKGVRENFFEYACKHAHLPLIIFSKLPLPFNDAEVHAEGLKLTVRDWRKIGEAAHLPSMKDIILVHKFTKAQVQVEQILQACEKLQTPEIFRDNFFSIFRHPVWFEELNCAFQLHTPFDYPLDLLIADCESVEAQGGCGKTELLERHNLIDGTPFGVFSLGTTGTVRGLTLNFKGSRVETGYLLNVPAVAKVDEFFSCVDASLPREEQKNDFFKLLNDLWEWRIRTSQSGNTPATTIKPRFRAIVAGNLPKEIPDMMTLTQKFNAPFIERNLCYFFTEEHRAFIETNKASVEKQRKTGKHNIVEIPIAPWLDFVRSIKIDYSKQTEAGLEKVFNDAFLVRPTEHTLSPVLSNRRLASIFKARYRHHLNCLFDGIIKLKHLPELNLAIKTALNNGQELKNLTIEPNGADFASIAEIVSKVVISWAEK